jgi:hypothetical protein
MSDIAELELIWTPICRLVAFLKPNNETGVRVSNNIASNGIKRRVASCDPSHCWEARLLVDRGVLKFIGWSE